ncbi:MAG: hypothetical protein ACOCWQ_03815 [Nanoarchaeota archaeon]
MGKRAKRAKKRKPSATPRFTYLNSIIHLHINYHLILEEKTAFLVAVAALILTIGISEILNPSFLNYPFLLKVAIIIASFGTAFSILISINAEKTAPVKRVMSFHPLSLTEFHEEAKTQFYMDLEKLCEDEEDMVRDYSDQIWHMKEEIYRKTQRIKWASALLLSSLFVGTLLAAIQLYIYII